MAQDAVVCPSCLETVPVLQHNTGPGTEMAKEVLAEHYANKHPAPTEDKGNKE